jgi:hypothetical protein
LLWSVLLPGSLITSCDGDGCSVSFMLKTPKFLMTHRLNQFWLDLVNRSVGIRVQVHTHPFEAFHSATDDGYPIVHSPGFLSLVAQRMPPLLTDKEWYVRQAHDRARGRLTERSEPEVTRGRSDNDYVR